MSLSESKTNLDKFILDSLRLLLVIYFGETRDGIPNWLIGRFKTKTLKIFRTRKLIYKRKKNRIRS